MRPRFHHFAGAPAPPPRASNACLFSHVALFLAALSVWMLSAVLYAGNKYYPEIGMVVHSRCRHRFRDWDGKFLKIQIGKNYVADRPHPKISYVKENNGALSVDRRRRLAQTNTTRPIILWGAHHKTGTFVAQKIFTLICAHMRWCCSFHVTRESVHAMKDALAADTVNMLGHTQWVWRPTEVLGSSRPYRFVHFYRHPLRKIISGYRYHRDGAEAWTTKPKRFANTCTAALPGYSVTNGTTVAAAAIAAGNTVPRSAVVDFCRSIHLCEACCRREHEADPGAVPRRYTPRSSREYEFLCAQLGRAVGGAPVADALSRRSAAEGLAVEAALQYFENLRMARVYNQTAGDPHTLHVDVDALLGNHAPTMRRLLAHLELGLSAAAAAQLLDGLSFFDLETSWLYRLGMMNLNHIGYHRNARQQGALLETLQANAEVMALYRPILDMMPAFKAPTMTA